METGNSGPAAAKRAQAAAPRQSAAQRDQFLQRFAEAALSLAMLPRYRHATLADLETLLTIPLMQGRVAIAYLDASDLADGSTHTSALPPQGDFQVVAPGSPQGESEAQSKEPSRHGETKTISGIAIWASVSAEVDAKIREQIKAQVFPIRLRPEDWTSGEIVWLLDVIAPSRELGTVVLANFKQVAKTARFNMHPVVSGSVDAAFLGQVKVGGG